MVKLILNTKLFQLLHSVMHRRIFSNRFVIDRFCHRGQVNTKQTMSLLLHSVMHGGNFSNSFVIDRHCHCSQVDTKHTLSLLLHSMMHGGNFSNIFGNWQILYIIVFRLILNTELFYFSILWCKEEILVTYLKIDRYCPCGQVDSKHRKVCLHFRI